MRERLIELIKNANRVAIWHNYNINEYIADALLAEGIIIPPKIVYFIVNKGTPYAFVSGKSPDYMQLYEIKYLKKNGYYLTKEEAEKALAEREGKG